MLNVHRVAIDEDEPGPCVEDQTGARPREAGDAVELVRDIDEHAYQGGHDRTHLGGGGG